MVSMSRADLDRWSPLRTAPIQQAAVTPASHRRFWRRRLIAAFVILAMFYLGIGIWLSFGEGLVIGDALSRVASARFALFSRTPHLAAIGFVFTPLTTLLQLPLVALLNPWPALLAYALPAMVVSALTMAGAAVQVLQLLVDRGMGRPWAYCLTAAFAFHPMIIYYGANGMSEAPFLLLMVVCARALQRWLESDDVHDLMVAGISLALAFLVRYDALAVGIAVGMLVFGTTWYRTTGSGGRRRSAALMDSAVVLVPLIASFLAWTAVSWLLTGEALAQFTSQYGNAAVLATSGGTNSTPLERGSFGVVEWLILQPFVLAVLASAVTLTALRRVPDALPVIATFGAVLGFQAAILLTGGTFPFLRFAIVVIPAAVVLAGIHRPRRGVLHVRRAGPAARLAVAPGRPRPLTQQLTRVGALITLAPAFVVAWVGMSLPLFAPQEYPVPAIVTPSLMNPSTRLAAAAQTRDFGAERELAAYLDSLELDDGAIVTDTLYGFSVVVASENPRQFVIPSDRDFRARLDNPQGFGVQYFLTVPNTGRGTTDAVNRRFPTIYETGAPVGVLALEIPSRSPGQPPYRLYRIIGSEQVTKGK